MLFLLFQVGADRYALETSRVVEVVPLLEFKRLPNAPKGVAGFFNYRGQPVPAVDLSELTLGRPAVERLSTRIVIVRQVDSEGKEHLLGLIAEHATEVVHKESVEFGSGAGQLRSAPYLGPVFMDAKGPVQWIREQHVLPGSIRNLLFSEAPAAIPSPAP